MNGWLSVLIFFADLASKCDVSEDLFLGIPAERADLIDRVACIDLGKPDESDRAGDDDARTPTAAAGGSSVDSPSIERTRSVAITSGIGRTQSLIGKSKDAASVSGEPDAEAENALGEATMATALAAVEIAGVLVEGGLENLTSLTSGGKEHIMDPRLINCHKLKHGCIPSANLYATASSLAAVGGQLCEGLREKQLSGQITSAVGAACDLLGFRPLSFHRGVLDFTLPDAAPASASSDSAPSKQEPSSLPPPTAFAMCALGGTMLFCVPSECISVAITVNQLSAKRSAALAIAKLVCRELNLGEPVDL